MSRRKKPGASWLTMSRLLLACGDIDPLATQDTLSDLLMRLTGKRKRRAK